MAVIETWLKQDLQELVHVKCLTGNLFSLDNGGNLIGVEVTDNGEPATLAGTVTANAILADGSTVAISGGTLSGNKVSVVLPEACYAVLGNITIAIKLTYNTTVTTLGCVIGVVYRSSTDTPVDPGTIIPSIQDLITQIQTAVASIPADYSSLWTTLAPEYTQTTYVVGQYRTNGGKLYRCKRDITQAEAFDPDHWEETDIGKELEEARGLLRAMAGTVEMTKFSGTRTVTSETAWYQYCDDGRVKIYGTPSGVRYLQLFRNPPVSSYSSSAFLPSVPAGTYIYRGELEYYNGGAMPRTYASYTYSNYSSGVSVPLNTKFTLTAPAMVGFCVSGNSNYGTEENPTYIKIWLERYVEKADQNDFDELDHRANEIRDTSAPAIFDEKSGTEVVISGAHEYPAEVSIGITFAQGGSGDPTPSNIRTITGRTGATLIHSPTSSASAGTSYAFEFPTAAGTVYGGTLTIHQDGSGTLLVDHKSRKISAFSWTYQSTYTTFRMSKSGVYEEIASVARAYGQNRQEAACECYSINETKTLSYLLDKSVLVGSSETTYKVWIKDTDYTDVDLWLAAVGDYYLCYKLASAAQVTYEIPADTVIQMLSGENHFWTSEGDQVSVKYKLDTKEEIEKVEAMIADSDTPTATQNYSAGDVFICEGKLVVATDSIASGEAIVIGSSGNASVINLADYIKGVKSTADNNEADIATLKAKGTDPDMALTKNVYWQKFTNRTYSGRRLDIVDGVITLDASGATSSQRGFWITTSSGGTSSGTLASTTPPATALKPISDLEGANAMRVRFEQTSGTDTVTVYTPIYYCTLDNDTVTVVGRDSIGLANGANHCIPLNVPETATHYALYVYESTTAKGVVNIYLKFTKLPTTEA